MKRFLLICIFIVSALSFCFAENGKNSDKTSLSKQNVQDEIFPPQKADIDLTKLNYNMATAVIYRILSDEDGRDLGKTVRIKGKYAYDDTVYGIFHYVLLFDATACCQTGFIFEDRRRKFPQDYPEPYDDIEIFGTLCEKTIDGMDIVYIECGK